MSRDNKEIIVGLDIGTSKIVALVAEVTAEGKLNIIGMGSQDSKGLKKGVVVNIEDTVATISRVLQEVELMADCKVKDVYTGIAGSHIKSFNSNGMVAIKDKEVTTMDVERVVELEDRLEREREVADQSGKRADRQRGEVVCHLLLPDLRRPQPDDRQDSEQPEAEPGADGRRCEHAGHGQHPDVDVEEDVEAARRRPQVLVEFERLRDHAPAFPLAAAVAPGPASCATGGKGSNSATVTASDG